MPWYLLSTTEVEGSTCGVYCRCFGILFELENNLITQMAAFTWDNTLTFQNHSPWEKSWISHGDSDC